MPEGKKKEKVTVRVKVTPKKAAPKKKAARRKPQQNNNKTVILSKRNMRDARSTTKELRHRMNVAAVSKLGPRSDAKQLSTIMEAITLPREATPIKMGTSKYGGDPTGSCNPFEQRSITFNTLATGNADYNKTNLMFAFRSLLRANVYSYVPSALIEYSAQDIIELTPGEFAEYNPGALQAVSTIQPHGQYLFSGRHGLSDQKRGFWLDLGANSTVSVNTTLPGFPPAGLVVTIYRSSGREWVQETQGNLLSGGASPGSFTWTPNTYSGYFAYTIGYVDPTRAQQVAFSFTITVQHSWNTNCGVCYGHVSVPDVQNQFGALDAVRITAVSLMCTNNSAAIQKQGTLCGVQFDKGTLWSDAVDFDHFTSNRKAKILPSDNGMYGFLKPLSEQDFDYLNEYTRSTNGDTKESLHVFPQLSDAAFIIIPETAYLGIAFDINRPAGTFPTGVTGYWTRAYGIEFLTNDQWRSLSRSNLSPEVLEIALHLISETPQWHENEFHIEDLWNSIKSFANKVVNGVLEYGPTVLKGATMLAPLLL